MNAVVKPEKKYFQAQGKSTREISEAHRRNIQTTQILKRMQDYVLGNKDKQTGEPVKMSATQVRAALGLLDKTISNLQTVDSNMILDQKVTPSELIDRVYKMSQDLNVTIEQLAPHIGVTVEQFRVMEATYKAKVINP